MGWEERRGHLCYYRSVRKGKRVRKVYVGSGALGQLVAKHDELKRCLRKMNEDRWKEERERLERSAGFLRELEEAAQILTRAELLASGYHLRKGTWRMLHEST